MRVLQQLTWFAAGLCGTCLLSAPGHAQLDAGVSNKGFALNRFEPAESGSEWFALDSVLENGHLRPAASLVLDYARKPLVLVDADGQEVVGVVDNHLYAHLGGSLVVWEDLRVALNLPVLLVNTGDGGRLNGLDFETDEGAALGDLRVAVDYRLLGEELDPARLSAGFRVHFPTGNEAAFAGDDNIRLTPQVMFAGDSNEWSYAARLGLGLRFRDGDFAGETFNSELQIGAAIGYRFLENRALLVGPELLAAPAVGGDGDGTFGNTNPVELLLGAHYDINDEWTAGIGIGPGLASGFGSPSFRMVASVGWSAPVDADSDGDGVKNMDDACPHVSGVRNSNPALNGCPAADADGDTIGDALDACPAVAGLSNADPSKHGCPVDADGDGIMDPQDACVLEPGPPNVDPAKHGCPLAKIDQGQIKIMEQVQFEVGSARIRPESDTVLQAVLRILKDHPEIARVSVEGHTDNRGTRDLNKALSNDRAASVVQWLVYNGVSSDRLSSVGFGPDRPIDDNRTELGRQKNRRVEFHIQGANSSSAPVNATSNTAQGMSAAATPAPAAPATVPVAPKPAPSAQTLVPSPAAAETPSPTPAAGVGVSVAVPAANVAPTASASVSSVPQPKPPAAR
jgi:OOP family OmpA-OmpF porin